MELLSTREARELFPLLDPSGVVGAAWIAGDGYVDPSSLTQAYAAGARGGGVKLLQNVFYVKPETGALAIGGWEPNTVPWGAAGIRPDFGPPTRAMS